MTTKELAALLNNTKYPVVISPELREIAKNSGLVIVYGYSDDLMEFDGVFYDEVDVIGGGLAYLTPAGVFKNECPEYDCPYYERLTRVAPSIEALLDTPECLFEYNTKIPHEVFNVIDGDALYCRGIVFSFNEICWSLV